MDPRSKIQDFQETFLARPKISKKLVLDPAQKPEGNVGYLFSLHLLFFMY